MIQKNEQISVFHGKNFLQLGRFVKCSHRFDIFPNSSEISPKIWSIYLKSMKYFHFLQENLCFLRIYKKFPNTQQGNLPIFFTVWHREGSNFRKKKIEFLSSNIFISNVGKERLTMVRFIQNLLSIKTIEKKNTFGKQ